MKHFDHKHGGFSLEGFMEAAAIAREIYAGGTIVTIECTDLVRILVHAAPCIEVDYGHYFWPEPGADWRKSYGFTSS